MPRSRHARLAVVAAVVVVGIAIAWRQGIFAGDPRWPLPERTTLDDAATAWRLLYTDDDPREAMPADAAARAAWLSRRSDQEDAVFAATGNAYVHFPYEETRPPDAEGAALRSWFLDYLRAERMKTDAAFPFDPTAPPRPAAISLDDRNAARLAVEGAARAAASVIMRRFPADGADPRQVVWLLDAGAHDLHEQRDASLARFVEAHPAVRVVHVPVSSPPVGSAALPPLGTRLSAAAVVDGKLMKDVVGDDQWTELLDARKAVAATRPRLAIPIVDAHVHLADDAADDLVAALASGAIARAVVAPLPKSVEYGDLDEANDRVLRAAEKYPDRLIPLVMISPLAPDPAADLERYLARGARGVKLLSGHDAYFRASGNVPLDDAKMRRVFKTCEDRDLPVLWHVNSHLYADGFLRVLRDFPRLRVVNPHFGGYLTYAPAAVRALLDRYPNLYFDVSLGPRAIYVRRSLEDLSSLAPAWRQLFTDHATRFLWGTDLVITASTSRSHTNAIYRLYRDLYEQPSYDFDFVPIRGYGLAWEDGHHRRGLTGMALPEDVLRRLYGENASRFYGAPR